LTNPFDVIEQITYLMFIRDLYEMDNTRKKDGIMPGLSYESMFAGKEHLKWSSLRDKPADIMYQAMQGEVFPFIKTLHSNKGSTYAKYMEDAIYKILTPRLLEQIVTTLDELYAIADKQPDKKTCAATSMSICSLNLPRRVQTGNSARRATSSA